MGVGWSIPHVTFCSWLHVNIMVMVGRPCRDCGCLVDPRVCQHFFAWLGVAEREREREGEREIERGEEREERGTTSFVLCVAHACLD